MVLVADLKADRSRSASPGVNFERGTIFVLPNAFWYESNWANFGAVEQFFTLSVACVADCDGFSGFGCSFH